MLNYKDLKYKPKKSDVVCLYKVVPKKGLTLAEAAEQVAAESSIGTWTDISTMNPKIARTCRPRVFYINNKNGLLKIAYPLRLFELGNMSGILSSICGNILGMAILKSLRVCDIWFPKEIVRSFPGPAFGIKGVRRKTHIKKRPFTGTIIKPKVGLDSRQHAKVAYEAWMGGLDIVKDDENLTSQSFNEFEKRVRLTLKKKKRAEKKTGKKKLYLANITDSRFDEMMRRSDLVKRLGGRVCMLDVVTLGFAALHSYRLKRTGQIIHAHRAMHGAITREPGFTISMLVLAKVYRMLGVDLLHIGTAGFGKMEGGKDEVLTIEKAIQLDSVPADMKNLALGQEWHGMKPCIAVASGGLSPLKIPGVMKVMGKDIVCQMGGGVHGHPDGTAAGAAAVMEATEAAMKGVPLKTYAKSHDALAKAVLKWG